MPGSGAAAPSVTVNPAISIRRSRHLELMLGPWPMRQTRKTRPAAMAATRRTTADRRSIIRRG